MNSIFGIDIGGTEVKIGKFVDDKLVLKTSIRTDLSESGKNILTDIFNTIDQLNYNDNLIGIGVGVPGPVVKGVVSGAENLRWKQYPALKIIQERYPKAKVRVINDANAAAIGEMAVGSAQKYRNFVFVTLGTGIGGGIVLNGEVLEGENGAAGEIGHMQVAYDNKRRCNCGRYGCHERYASATGLVLTAKELMIGKKTILQGVELSSKVIFDFAKAGDAVALQAVEMMVDTLGRTLANIAAVLNPEAFVIGGGVSKAGTFLLEKVQDKFQKYCFYTLKDTKFELASLGNDAGIYGTSYAVR